MKLERRSVFGWPATRAGYGPCKNGLVVHYDGSNQGLAGKSHASCRAYWKSTRKFHMGPSRGWADIGYSWAVCPHGIGMEGRGWQKVQAAQPGGNSTWTSVTFMSGPNESPTVAQVNAFRELRAWLRGKGLAAAVRGHRDFISTSCPGSRLYQLVKNGAFTGAPTEEDDMPSPRDLWMWDGIPAPDTSGTKETNTHWQPSNLLRETYDRLVEVKGMVAAQAATIDKLVDAVAAGPGVDVDALKQEVREAIESVRVRLDVENGET